MVGIVLSAEDLRQAPPLVREWLQRSLSATVASPAGRASPEEALASCSLPEAEQVLERLRNDYPAIQVFFDLGRAGGGSLPEAPHLHAIAIADLVQHTHLNIETVAGCLDRITAAFRAASGDPKETLFAIDQAGTLYLRQETHQAIGWLWHQIAERAAPSPAAPPPPNPPGEDQAAE